MPRIADYPFENLGIGDAMDVPLSDVKNEASFRSFVSKRAAQLGMRLSVRRFDAEGILEVSRIQPEERQPSVTFRSRRTLDAAGLTTREDFKAKVEEERAKLATATAKQANEDDLAPLTVEDLKEAGY